MDFLTLFDDRCIVETLKIIVTLNDDPQSVNVQGNDKFNVSTFFRPQNDPKYKRHLRSEISTMRVDLRE